MKRSISMSLAGVAAATTLVAGVGTTAAFNDTERGTGTLESGTFDLQVGVDCSSLMDTNTTELVVASTTGMRAMAPGDTVEYDLCISNVGSLPGELSATIPAAEVADVEVGSCSEPEKQAGDTTCEAGAEGELSSQLRVTMWDASCTSGEKIGDPFIVDANLRNFATPKAVLESGHDVCFVYQLKFADLPGSQNNRAQSDEATFKVVFDFQQADVTATDLTTISEPAATTEG